MQKILIGGLVVLMGLGVVGYLYFQPVEVVPEDVMIDTLVEDEIMPEEDLALTTTVADEGDFILVIEPAKTDETKKYQEYMETSGDFEPIIDDLNETFALPHDVPITFTNCDEANAFYIGETKSMTYCYELMQDVDKIYAGQGLDEDAQSQALYNNTLATLFHEMGHAMIDIQQIPITGREEDVADQISTYILLDTYEDSAEAVLDAAEEYYVNAEGAELDESSYADTHTLDLARYYNLVCWVYGSDEEEFETLPETSGLPTERAEGCSGEYDQFKKSLDILFKDFVKA